MKIYVVSNTRKLKKIQRALQEDFCIEERENLRFKMTKNDYVIVCDEVGQLDGLENLKNIFLLTMKKEYFYIWSCLQQFKIVDIIDSELNENYIAQRIKSKIKEG